MRTVLLSAVLCIASTLCLAQPKDEKAQDRVRTEGSAGGLGQELTKEQRDAVKTGEGPHRTFKEKLRKAKKGPEQGGREHDEKSSERSRGRGAQ